MSDELSARLVRPIKPYPRFPCRAATLAEQNRKLREDEWPVRRIADSPNFVASVTDWNSFRSDWSEASEKCSCRENVGGFKITEWH